MPRERTDHTAGADRLPAPYLIILDGGVLITVVYCVWPPMPVSSFFGVTVLRGRRVVAGSNVFAVVSVVSVRIRWG